MDIVCQIGPFQSSTGARAKLKVKVRLNLHGIVSVESATVSIQIHRTVFVDLILYFNLYYEGT